MHKMFRRALKSQKGFTLVELMVVVVIIGVLVAIAIPVYNNVSGNARDRACDANIRTLEGAASMYQAETGNAIDDTNYEDLWEGFEDSSGTEIVLIDGGQSPECPWESGSVYSFDGEDWSCNGTGCKNN